MAGRLAFAIGLFCALIGTQGPEFAQQYRQRLAGAIDELTRIVATFNDEAASHSLKQDEAVARLEANSDPLARERGADMNSDVKRLNRLKASLAAFRESSSMERLVLLARNYDAQTALQTWKDFEPAIPTSTEAIAVGALAFCWGWGATHLCAWPIRRHLRRREQRREVNDA
jgi:Protein of unknown function (DUF2937)